MGKGDKERLLPISPPTAKALWQYVTAERKEARPNDALFVGLRGVGMTRSGLLQLVRGLGERAGIAGVHPHIFRHTFAINFLRNGGGAYELQLSLGHESMEMVRAYLSLANSDLAAAHEKASPVTGWHLQ
jgi:integrase/recombinase XerD